MKNLYLSATFIAVAALLGACGSTPKSTAMLDQAHNEYRIAQNNPNVATYAPLALAQAGDAVAQADAQANARASSDQIDALAYLARQKIALTQELTKQKMAEADIANAGQARNQLLLDQRTNEANAANIRANQSGLLAMLARDDAERAQQNALRLQDQAQKAQRSAQDADVRNAQLEAQLADMAAQKTDRGMVITLGDVLFGTDQSRLNPEGQVSAQKLAKLLQLNPSRTVLVEGFADSTGSTAYNLELSERRANAVLTALQEMGIGRERVATHGYGERYPVADNETAQNRQLNRRVEIVLSDESGHVMNR